MTDNRQLRTTVTPELYAEVQRYARILDMSTARSAAFLLAWGVAFFEAWAELESRKPDMAEEGSS